MKILYHTRKDKKIEFKLVKKMIPFLIIGVFIGTWLVTKMESDRLRTYFLCFLVIIGININPLRDIKIFAIPTTPILLIN